MATPSRTSAVSSSTTGNGPTRARLRATSSCIDAVLDPFTPPRRLPDPFHSGSSLSGSGWSFASGGGSGLGLELEQPDWGSGILRLVASECCPPEARNNHLRASHCCWGLWKHEMRPSQLGILVTRTIASGTAPQCTVGAGAAMAEVYRFIDEQEAPCHGSDAWARSHHDGCDAGRRRARVRDRAAHHDDTSPTLTAFWSDEATRNYWRPQRNRFIHTPRTSTSPPFPTSPGQEPCGASGHLEQSRSALNRAPSHVVAYEDGTNVSQALKQRKIR